MYHFFLNYQMWKLTHPKTRLQINASWAGLSGWRSCPYSSFAFFVKLCQHFSFALYWLIISQLKIQICAHLHFKHINIDILCAIRVTFSIPSCSASLPPPRPCINIGMISQKDCSCIYSAFTFYSQQHVIQPFQLKS